jgi:hypothetical protein
MVPPTSPYKRRPSSLLTKVLDPLNLKLISHLPSSTRGRRLGFLGRQLGCVREKLENVNLLMEIFVPKSLEVLVLGGAPP